VGGGRGGGWRVRRLGALACAINNKVTVKAKDFLTSPKKLPRAEKSARRLNWFLEFLFYFI